MSDVNEGIAFFCGVVLGGAFSSLIWAHLGEVDLQVCAKKHNVYRCHQISVPDEVKK